MTAYPFTNPPTALFVLSPCHADDVRCEGRRPHHDNASASTNIPGARRGSFLSADAHTFRSIERARRRRRLARSRSVSSARTTCPTPPPSCFHRAPHAHHAEKMQRSSQHVAAISSTSSSSGAPYPTLRLSTPSVSSAATRPRRQTCWSETATCGAVSPFPSACAATTDRVRFRLKRRAAVLASALPVRAPSAMSR